MEIISRNISLPVIAPAAVPFLSPLARSESDLLSLRVWFLGFVDVGVAALPHGLRHEQRDRPRPRGLG